MKSKIIAALAVASLLLTGQHGFAQAAKKEKSVAATELGQLMTKVQAKMRGQAAGAEGAAKAKPSQLTEADLSAELKEFDALLAKHKGDKSDDVAQILYMKSMLYTQVLRDSKKGEELMAQLKTDFPDSRQVAGLKKQEEAKKIQSGLAVGTKFPDFNEKDTAGKPLSIANYKGRVVLIDFWATWCGPCVKELPSVQAAYDKHHKKGFEIIGISLDSDQSKLDKFVKDKNMTWQQFFDGKGWSNKLSTKYGVNSIPATYLLDGEGKIIGKNLRGEALEEAVAKALGKS